MKRRTVNGLLLGVREAAALIGNSERSLRALIAQGVVPARRFAGRIVFRRAELEKWIENLPGLSLKDAELNRKARG
jgi:excisionase family DNA binding protein